MSCHYYHPHSNHTANTPDGLALEEGSNLRAYDKAELSGFHSPSCNAEQHVDHFPVARDCQMVAEPLSDAERRVRKRAQNRVAQRSYRNRMKQKVIELEQQLCAMRAQMQRQSISYGMSTSPMSPGSSYIGQHGLEDTRRYSDGQQIVNLNSYLPLRNLPFRPEMDNERIQDFGMGPESLFSTSNLGDYLRYGDTEGFQV